MRTCFAVLLAVFALVGPARALDLTADVVILGETHDNPAHHAMQRDLIVQLAPRAVVFEQLTPNEARDLAGHGGDTASILKITAGFHWGNIADYVDVIAVSPVVIGAAMARDDVRRAFSDGAAAVFGPGAARYGLVQDLPPEEGARRETLQFEAHCEAMPREMMGGMVEAQRLRDAAFAQTVLQALESHGSPVVLVTGNGHARTDWGVPAVLAKAAPDLSVLSVGMSNDGQIEGDFDAVLDAPAVTRPDPCAAFR